MKQEGETLGVTVFGPMPYESGRRLVAISDKEGAVWGPLEVRGSLRPETPSDMIRARITGLLRDHGLPPDATDFGGDYLLESAVTELRWCLRILASAGGHVQEACSPSEALLNGQTQRR